MILIFGGAYQGKSEYAIKELGFNEQDFFRCSEDSTDIDLTKKVISDLSDFTLACVKSGKEPVELLNEVRAQLEDKIIIATDVSQGVVPMDKTERMWREANGRALIYLGEEAESVVRVFCGIGQRIK